MDTFGVANAVWSGEGDRETSESLFPNIGKENVMGIIFLGKTYCLGWDFGLGAWKCLKTGLIVDPVDKQERLFLLR